MSAEIIIDSELLIMEVECRPILWNYNCEEYKNKLKKREAWLNICSVFVPDFEEKSEQEKTQIENTFVNKWRNIRDNYIRYRKKLAESKSVRKAGRSHHYIYSDKLGFLAKIIDIRSLVTNPDKSETEAQPAGSVVAQPAVSIVTQDAPDFTQEDEMASDNGNDVFSQKEPPGKKRKVSIEDKLLEFLESNMSCKNTSLDNDEDYLFFRSLVPTVKLLDEDQKFRFRMAVLQILECVRKRVDHHLLMNMTQPLFQQQPASYSFTPNSQYPTIVKAQTLSQNGFFSGDPLISDLDPHQ